jgi:hypothetical protein
MVTSARHSWLQQRASHDFALPRALLNTGEVSNDRIDPSLRRFDVESVSGMPERIAPYRHFAVAV